MTWLAAVKTTAIAAAASGAFASFYFLCAGAPVVFADGHPAPYMRVVALMAVVVLV